MSSLLLLNALGYGLGIVGSVFSIWQFIESRKNPSARKVAFVSAVVAITIFLVTYFAVTVSPPSPPKPQNTATSVPTASSASCSSTPYGKTCVLSDPLGDNSKGYRWNQTSNSDGSGCEFKDGAYHVLALEGGSFVPCTASNTTFSDFAYEVKMRFVGGTQANGVFGGITFRYGNDGSCYAFLIGIYGRDILEKVPQGVLSNNNILDSGYLDATNASFNKGLNQDNLVAVVVQGSSISVYINRAQVMTVVDTTYSSGHIGVIALVGQGATPNRNGSTEIAFSNAQVWK
jgi:hypothetical protein